MTIQATCRICHKTIRKNCSGMRGHLTSKHQINIEDKPVVFQKSKLIWKKSEKLLKIHQSYTHNEKEGTICDLCGKVFQHKTSLQSHNTHIHEG